jgi:hypothetical protein
MLDQPLTADGNAAAVGGPPHSHRRATDDNDEECGNGTGRNDDERGSYHSDTFVSEKVWRT